MREVLERLNAAWKNLPQSTKLLLAGLLLVSAVSLWYVAFYLPSQVPAATQAPALEPRAPEAPKALEAPPIPPLAEGTEAPKPSPSSPQAPAPTAQEVKPAPLPVPQARPESPPPNPFVPLLVEAPPPAPLPAPSPTLRPTPVPRGAPVRVSQGTPLPTPSLSSGPTPLPGSAGALPPPKVVRPALPGTPGLGQGSYPESPVAPEAPTSLVEAPLPQERVPQEAGGAREAPKQAPAKTPLEALVEAKGLKLSGTLLGPVSVAILESREGYLVLPVGSPIPGSEAVVRRIEGDRVVLALKDETLEIPLVAQTGGER